MVQGNLTTAVLTVTFN